jgi:ubiquinone/menaquinone biosynthesis C-methylase UbiE
MLVVFEFMLCYSSQTAKISQERNVTHPESISFDRAAGFYDQTRGFPPGMSALVAQTAVDLLGSHTRVLEIGVGTGRIAKPLMGAGVQVTGIDLSRPMMNRLRDTLGDLTAPALIEGDITRLPFASESFDAVIGVHILHLVSGWQRALDEALRVMKAGGAILLGRNSYHPNDTQNIRTQLGDLMDKYSVKRSSIGVREDDVEQELLRRGATVKTVETQPVITQGSVAKEIDAIANRIWSSTWAIPDDVMPAIIAQLKANALRDFGTLEHTFDVPHTFTWKKFTFATALA